jgi:uncharacterized membrane protein
MEICLIIGLFLLIMGVVVVLSEKDNSGLCLVILGTWISSTAAIFLVVDEKPSALDVYRGKTTLAITYRDSIAVDSVVVFK